MKLLLRKARKDTAEFSRQFYDRSVFCSDLSSEHSPPDPTGVHSMVIAESAQSMACSVDATFEKISLRKLNDELLALRFEMIGTAWTDANKYEVAFSNSVFTKQYLADIDRVDIWKVMREYNCVIPESVAMGINGNSRLGIAHLTYLNTTRFNLAYEWAAIGCDLEACARVVNRIGVRKTQIVYPLLAARLLDRVGFKGSEAVIEPLAAVAYGFYQGAKEALRGVKLTV